MRILRPTTKIARAGLVISIFAAAVVVISLAAALPALDNPPHSREWLDVRAKAEVRKNKEDMQKAFADAFGVSGNSQTTVPSIDMQQSSDEVVERFLDENRITPMPPDTSARWTIQTYLASAASNISAVWKRKDRLFFSVILLASGLYLLLAYDLTLGRILGYVMNEGENKKE